MHALGKFILMPLINFLRTCKHTRIEGPDPLENNVAIDFLRNIGTDLPRVAIGPPLSVRTTLCSLAFRPWVQGKLLLLNQTFLWYNLPSEL